MSSVQRLHVSPKLPTALAGHERLYLPGSDMLLLVIMNAHLLPTKLDIPAFEQALSKTLQLYPHAAGRLRSVDGSWFIELANTSVPVDIEYRLDATSGSFFDDDWVVQDDLSPFLNHQPSPLSPMDGDAPLLGLKLTMFENETCVGVSWHHVLGDAMLILRFMHTLSQFYQEQPLEYPPPTFDRYRFPTPSTSTTAEVFPRAAHLHFTCPVSEFVPAYIDFLQNYQNVKWQFNLDELDEFRTTLSSRTDENGYLSKQDCLSAYVVAALNRNASEPVQMVLNASSYRHVKAPFISENMAGNMILSIPATVPSDVTGVAVALRRALEEGREPEYIHHVMPVISDNLMKLANAQKVLDLTKCNDTVMTVNSYVLLDWCSIHFGCQEGSRYYTTAFFKNWLRCFRSNPVKGEDGAWMARQSVEISVGVKTEMKPKFVETLARGFQHILDVEDTDL